MADELNDGTSSGGRHRSKLFIQNGITFFGTYWKRETTRVFKDISLDEIAQMSPELAMAIQDPEMKEGVEEMLFPLFSEKAKSSKDDK